MYWYNAGCSCNQLQKQIHSLYCIPKSDRRTGRPDPRIWDRAQNPRIQRTCKLSSIHPLCKMKIITEPSPNIT